MSGSGKDQRGRPGPALAERVWLALALAVVLIWGGGCGFKTPPEPLEEKLPPTGDLQARQRTDSVLISWPVPPREQAEKLEGVRIRLESRPLDCLNCPAGLEQTRWVDARGARPLRRDAGKFWLVLPLPKLPPGHTLRIWLANVYPEGESPPGTLVVLEPAIDIPVPTLLSEPLPVADKPQAGGGRRLYWKQVQERIAMVAEGQGRPVEQLVFFRGNIYGRKPGDPWPEFPLNRDPIEDTQWLLPPVLSVSPQGNLSGGREQAGSGKQIETAQVEMEFVLRFVNSLGAEGPASAPVTASVLVTAPRRAENGRAAPSGKEHE
ncbi:MAG: hypothetical protein OEZ59_01355 [Deltaproteobacteria bacterium]|nr:hypothetical protein [Deltaproteobacteria bacterium]